MIASKRTPLSIVSILSTSALALQLLAACPEPNPNYCASDEECRDSTREAYDPALPECHGEGHFCYAGCTSDGDCQEASQRWYRSTYSRCDLATHDCIAPSSSDARPSIDGDGGGDGDGGSGRAKGAKCTADTQCSTGHCIDGVCCTGDCKETCRACNLPDSLGDCAPLPAGTAVPSDCPGDEGCSGTCDGKGACTFPGTATVCRKSCAVGEEHIFQCTAAHACVEKTSKACSPTLCDSTGTACLPGCRNHGECVSGSLCDRSAAHVSGLGECVAPENVHFLTSTTEIADALGSLEGKTYLAIPVRSDPSPKYTAGIVISTGTVHLVGLGGAAPVRLDPANDGPAIRVTGGADVTIQGLQIEGATGIGGDGVFCQGDSSTRSKLVIVESRLRSNEGQGIEASYCDVTLHRNVIQSNQGGGVSLADGAFVVVNNLIVDNGKVSSATLGGLSLGAAGTGSFVSNNTVVHNGGAHIPQGGGLNCFPALTVTNSIVYFNGASPTQGCTVRHSDVEGITPTNGNVSESPGFASTSETYCPGPSTKCIDGGEALTAAGVIDLYGNSRQKGAGVDMGACEVK